MTLFARRAALPEATGYSVVDEQMVIRGEIASEGTIRVDGRIEGRLHRADTLIVGRTGTVVGDIEAREVVVAGAVQGNILADRRIEVQSTGSIRGDVRARTMLLEEGGCVHGHVAVEAEPDAAAASVPRLELAPPRSTPALPG